MPNQSKLSLTSEQIQAIKQEAVYGHPYADRVSLVLAMHLLTNRDARQDYFPILDELNYLEGINPTTRTKPERKFQMGVISFLFHKHYSSAGHICRNLRDQLDFNNEGENVHDYFTETITAIIREHGENPDIWPGALVHALVIGGYQDHARRGFTGDWIVFGKYKGQNYYLSLATHAEGRNSEHLLERLRQNCEAEFPFIFQARQDIDADQSSAPSL